VLHVAVQLAQFRDLPLMLGVDGIELFIDRMQLLVRALQLLVRSDKLFVACLQFFVAGLKLFDRGLQRLPRVGTRRSAVSSTSKEISTWFAPVRGLTKTSAASTQRRGLSPPAMGTPV
jgi:hypothetical protein